MRLLRTIGSVDFTGQERAALNKLTVSMIPLPIGVAVSMIPLPIGVAVSMIPLPIGVALRHGGCRWAMA